MKKIFFILLFFLFCHQSLFTWGFFAHYKINKMAVFTLPQSMNSFFLNHIHYLEEKAVDADKRRYTDENEASKHYIDIDYYSVDSPFIVMPKNWDDAVNKFTEDTLLEYGILPWQIQRQYALLVNAFRNHQVENVIRYSSDIGHYLADAHVPLHTTLNYNGQLTKQEGIHAFWESRLPELFAENYNFILPKVKYVDDVLAFVWSIIEKSHQAKDSVLHFEAQLNLSFDSDKKYSIEEKGNSNSKVYSVEYSQAYHSLLNNMVERQMRSSVYDLGCIWYSAWIDAGQPDIDNWSFK